jgi:hypothetical protein
MDWTRASTGPLLMPGSSPSWDLAKAWTLLEGTRGPPEGPDMPSWELQTCTYRGPVSLCGGPDPMMHPRVYCLSLPHGALSPAHVVGLGAVLRVAWRRRTCTTSSYCRRGYPRFRVPTELMIKGSKHIVDLEQGCTSTPEVQPVAFKATKEKKEESTSSRLPIDASKLDNEEMALIIKSFCQILKQRRGKDYKTCSKRVCYKCGKPDHFIAKCPMSSDSDRDNDKREKKKEKKRYYKKKGSDAHVCREWDSDESSTDSSSDEDAANITVNKGLLFHNVGHKCLLAKDGKKKKVQTRTAPKYTTSSYEGSSSDDEDDLLTLFANLNMQQKEKLNELIGAIHEKDELLDSQEEFLIKENKKHVKVKNAYAQEVDKKENLTKELSMCHDSITNLRNENTSLIAKIDKLNESISSLKTENASLISKAKELKVCNDSISCLRDENAILHAKIEELNACIPSTSSVNHVTICNRCRDVNVDAINDHLALIKQQNDQIAQLTAKINEHEIENENFKFAKSMLYSGRHPGIKDGIGF